MILNAVFVVVVNAIISFMALQYFNNVWTNWVLFISFLIIAFMIWSRMDPHRGNWTINGWITRSVGIVIFLVLAFTLGF
ncbi:hypothetical protein CSV74_13985 [Sporosarcina sp. P19]|nr:hypothetical protein CSV74_13985 [Sporosarcina sp. P19]